MFEFIKKWGPPAGAGLAGAAVADAITRDRGIVWRIGVGLVLIGGALYGAHAAGLSKLG